MKIASGRRAQSNSTPGVPLLGKPRPIPAPAAALSRLEVAAVLDVAEVLQLLALGAVHLDLAARDRLARREPALELGA